MNCAAIVFEWRVMFIAPNFCVHEEKDVSYGVCFIHPHLPMDIIVECQPLLTAKHLTVKLL